MPLSHYWLCKESPSPALTSAPALPFPCPNTSPSCMLPEESQQGPPGPFLDCSRNCPCPQPVILPESSWQLPTHVTCQLDSVPKDGVACGVSLSWKLHWPGLEPWVPG